MNEKQNGFERNEKAKTPETILDEYESLTGRFVKNYRTEMMSVASTYQHLASEEAKRPGTHDITSVLKQVHEVTGGWAEKAEERAEILVTAIAEMLPETLSEHDQDVLRFARADAEAYGANSKEVKEALTYASSRKTRKAMRAALDDITLQQVNAAAFMTGAESAQVDEALTHASSRQAKAAMRAALDKRIFSRLDTEAEMYGLETSKAQNLLNSASSRYAKSAMHAAMDARMFNKAAYKADLHGVLSPEVEKQLIYTSSPAAQNAMLNYLFHAEYIKQHRYNKKSNHEEAPDADAGEAKTETEPEKPKTDAEVDRIIERVVQENRRNSWMSSEKDDVRRVINTIRKLREGAEEAGKPITDREIYTKYHHAANKPDDGKESAADKRLRKSFQIVSAMMGGHKGKLPF